MKKGKTPLPSILRVVGIVIVITIGINTINAQTIVKSSKKAAKMHYKAANTVQKSANKCKETAKRKIEVAEAEYEEPIVEEIQENNNEIDNIVESNENINNEIQSIVDTSYTTRMTSYYPEEGENITASGLTPNDFGINENGWFTYNGKLVVATASHRLGYTEMKTYNLYDELILNIDGIDYNAVVLDVCGFCQHHNRIDLFVSSSVYAKDTQIIVKQ